MQIQSKKTKSKQGIFRTNVFQNLKMNIKFDLRLKIPVKRLKIVEIKLKLKIQFCVGNDSKVFFVFFSSNTVVGSAQFNYYYHI